MAPFVMLNTRGHGNLRTCCSITGLWHGIPKQGTIDDVNAGYYQSNKDTFDLSEDSIEEVWNSEFMRDFRMKMLRGETIPNCSFCYEMEAKGLNSKRTGKNELYYEEAVENGSLDRVYSQNGYQNQKPRWWEVRLSTKCNLSCYMCSPSLSSMMFKEYSKHYDKLPDHRKGATDAAAELYTGGYLERSEKFKEQIIDNIDNVEFLELRGGEVFSDNTAIKFIERISEYEQAKNITLDISTNGTIMNDRILCMLNRFKGGKLKFSIDAYGKEDEYIRHLTNWGTVVDNMRKAGQLNKGWLVIVQATIGVLQVCTVDKLLWFVNDFVEEHQFPVFLSISNIRGFEYLRFENIELESRKHVIKNVEEFIATSSYCNTGPHAQFNYQTVSRFLTSLHNTMEITDENIVKCVEYLDALDKMRGKSVLDVFPHMHEIYHKYSRIKEDHQSSS